MADLTGMIEDERAIFLVQEFVWKTPAGQSVR
jgi:hypothetical protein